MKHKYTDEEYQVAIDAACEESALRWFAATKDSPHWIGDAEPRLQLLKSALDKLPETQTSELDKWADLEERIVKAVRFAVQNHNIEPEKSVDGLQDALVNFDGAKPAEIPWIEWHGGECPLKDDEVEKWECQYRSSEGAIDDSPILLSTPPRLMEWRHYGLWGDIIAYRVTKWREGHGPAAVDWKAKFEAADFELCEYKAIANGQSKVLSDLKARSEKAEVELAQWKKVAGDAEIASRQSKLSTPAASPMPVSPTASTPKTNPHERPHPAPQPPGLPHEAPPGSRAP